MPPTPSEPPGEPGAADDPSGDDGATSGDDQSGAASERGRAPVGRRRVLRALVDGGYAAGVAAVLKAANVVPGRDSEVTATYAVAHDDPGDPSTLVPRTTSVPAGWHDRLERSFELRDQLLGWDVEGLRDLFVVPGSLDDPAPALSLTVADGGVRDRLLEQFRDVSVDLDVAVLEDLPARERATPQSDPVTVASVDRPSIPGGVLCGAESGTRGSLAPALYDRRTGEQWFATANHLYGAAGTRRTSHAGEPLYVVGNQHSRAVGEVTRGYPREDVVQVRPTDGVSPTSALYGETSVGGQFTRLGLALLKARGEPLEKVGAFSGHTTGEIKGIDGVTCYAGEVCKTGQLKWGGESAITDGDSGSVNYHADPERPDGPVLVGGVNSARTWWPGANFAWGTGGHHLLERRGLHF